MIENRKIEYLKPVRIIDCSKNVINKEALLVNEYDQVGFNHDNMLTCIGKGFIVLDFGKELCGGIRILHNYKPHQRKELKIKVSFGESVSECYFNSNKKNNGSHQSIKKAKLLLPTLSDFSFGDTGFRFVRIDFLTNKTYNIPNIYAKSYSNNHKQLGSFKCDNELVNKIFDTCKYTLSLCIQNNIWDAIKRDRLVWVGDLEPEIRAISYIYGDIPEVDKSLDFAIKEYPLPSWFGRIPSYNSWYIKIIKDYYYKTANKEFVNKRLDYIYGILNQFDKVVDESGNVDFNKVDIENRGYFIDWPTYRSSESIDAYSYLLLYTFKDVRKMFVDLSLDLKVLDSLIARLDKKEMVNLTYKQLIAFEMLAKKPDSIDLYNKLIKDDASGMGVFLSFYILDAISKIDINQALKMMNQYYGSMLELGATSFFEEHDINWAKDSLRIDEVPVKGKVDYHGDFGVECYKGFRMSLCHGWSVGPIHFLIEDVLGLEVLEPGYKKIKVKPNLGNLKFVEACIPTNKGLLEIKVVNNEGTYSVNTNKVEGIEIVFD